MRYAPRGARAFSPSIAGSSLARPLESCCKISKSEEDAKDKGMSSRSALIALAESRVVRSIFTKSGLSNPLVKRFVAGETLQDALIVSKELQDKGILSAIDVLGENVSSSAEADRATEMYLGVIKALSTFHHDAYLS